MVTLKSRALYALFKRVFDIVGAFVLLLAVAPILLITAIAIRFDSKGPAIFKQRRVGKGMKEFTAYKFRSMCLDGGDQIHKEYIQKLMRGGLERETGGVYKLTRDPRITRVGRLIRRLSIDELPQLWNVLKGEMSLIGPRPAIPYELEYHEDWMLERFSVKPGLTGWWQVSGRSATDYRQMVEKDIYYVKNARWQLDFLILSKTLVAVFQIKRAY